MLKQKPDKNHRNWQQTFAEELKIIRSRRGSDAPCDGDLVGLALSGGGIRSATFALGVLEGLKSCSLLQKVDYLSTVSGGGYIGAWLTANCTRAAKCQEESWLSPKAIWKDSIDHLRRYSNYLAPKVGFFSADTWSMVTIWLRNALLIQVTVILAIAAVLLAPRPLEVAFVHWPAAGNGRWVTIALFILGVVGIAGNQLRLGQKGSIPLLQAKSWRMGLAGAVCCFALARFAALALHFDPFFRNQINWTAAALVAGLLIIAGFWLQPVAVEVVKRLWRGQDAPDQINYTQSWVQAAVVLPMLAVGFLVSAILWGESQIDSGELAKVTTFSGFFQSAWHYWPFPLSVVFISLWLLSFCSIGSWRNWRSVVAGIFAPIPAMLVLHSLLSGVMVLFHQWASDLPKGDWLAFMWGPPLVLYSFSLTIVMLIGMMGRQSTEDVREWWSRFGAWLLIYGMGWMAISVAAVYGPLAGAIALDTQRWKGVSLTWLFTTVAGLVAGRSSSTGSTAAKSSISAKALDWVALIAPFVFIAGLLIAVSATLHLLILNILDLNSSHGRQGWLEVWHWWTMESANLDWPIVLYLMAGCVAAFLVMAARVDINEFSLNAFYRARLVRCYLGATRLRSCDKRNPQNFTGFDDDDDLYLAQVIPDERNPPGPLHIINCALNLGGSGDLALHTRHSANFTLTPRQCGSSYESRTQAGRTEELGYRPTSEFGGCAGQPKLGQAISVSGAAASPNRGYHTSPAVAFLLTTFNVRLGWWFPNPRAVHVDSPSPWFSLRYLLNELFGGANDKSRYLAISDGGHFENLAGYELIKRQCRVVIVSDAECDASLQFEGLGNLIRICNVDFGARIEIDVSAIRYDPTPDSTGIWSKGRCAVGTITYQDGSTGTLIYLKASMTGRESSGVLQYKSAHPSFPHESTGNQFYGEDQFESYRSLGFDIAMRTFETVAEEQSFVALAGRLKRIFSSNSSRSDSFTRHSTRLMDLWADQRKNPGFQFLDSEVAAYWPEQMTPDFGTAFYLCREMIQLMENVYMDLRLEETWDQVDNAGWMATFEGWSKSPALRKTWELTTETYGWRFRYFCQQRFGLPLSGNIRNS